MFPYQHQSLIDQLSAAATDWVARGDVAMKMLRVLIEQDEDETPFILTLAREDPALIRSLVILAICEAREKAERARDPEDVVFLSIDERCQLESLMGVLGEVKEAGVSDEQASKIDSVISALAHFIKL